MPSPRRLLTRPSARGAAEELEPHRVTTRPRPGSEATAATSTRPGAVVTSSAAIAAAAALAVAGSEHAARCSPAMQQLNSHEITMRVASTTVCRGGDCSCVAPEPKEKDSSDSVLVFLLGLAIGAL